MNKTNLQKELKEKVKPGVKPSDLKKQREKKINLNEDEGYISDNFSRNNRNNKDQSEQQKNNLSLKKDKQIKQLEQERNFEAKKAQNYLEQITKLTAEVDSKEQAIKELTAEKNQLIDQYNELRINNLQQRDYFTKYQTESKLNNQLKLQLAKSQKDLTITQQDLKKAQRIIELRTLKPADNDQAENSFDY